MAEMKILDLNELGRAVDVPSREFTPPIPGAKPMLEQVWDGDYVQKAVDYLQKNYKSKGGQYSILGHVPSWVCIAFADALMPECECFFATPNHDENNTFTHLPIHDLKTGALDPSIPYQQTVREEGDFIYVDFGLTEDVSWEELINKVSPNLTLPELPAGKNVCLFSNAHYPLQWVVINHYAKNARGVFCADHDAPVYRCAIPGTSGYKYGEEVPRKA